MDKEVISLYRQGLPVREIWETVGITKWSFYKTLHRHNVHLRQERPSKGRPYLDPKFRHYLAEMQRRLTKLEKKVEKLEAEIDSGVYSLVGG